VIAIVQSGSLILTEVSSGRSMTSVYSDPEWSINIDATVARLSGPGVELEAVLAWLGERAKEENFSLTDIWGVFTSAGIMKQVPGPPPPHGHPHPEAQQTLRNIQSICPSSLSH